MTLILVGMMIGAVFVLRRLCAKEWAISQNTPSPAEIEAFKEYRGLLLFPAIVWSIFINPFQGVLLILCTQGGRRDLGGWHVMRLTAILLAFLGAEHAGGTVMAVAWSVLSCASTLFTVLLIEKEDPRISDLFSLPAWFGVRRRPVQVLALALMAVPSILLAPGSGIPLWIPS